MDGRLQLCLRRKEGVVCHKSPYRENFIMLCLDCFCFNEKGGLGGSSTVEIDSTGDIHKDTDEEQQNKA